MVKNGTTRAGTEPKNSKFVVHDSNEELINNTARQMKSLAIKNEDDGMNDADYEIAGGGEGVYHSHVESIDELKTLHNTLQYIS